ncbi:hypothetical protein [Sphingobium yanoikuyae]|uniref:hypothetical protein n=1 Tax=Sphingobium yanoikuyae TaxID=13690 RepID=UPI000847CF9D|nr:hypothetical protein [Sphingobium yanoikuyae]RSU75863.1 hypothetical protein BRX37_10240 [Sphingomonas sp. S-NIH.Pt3_0716]
MNRLNELLERLDQKRQCCIEAEQLVEEAYAAGILQDSHIDAFEIEVNQYEEILAQASRELEALDAKLRDWK